MPIKRYKALNKITPPAIPNPTNNPREPIFRAVTKAAISKITTKAPYKILDASTTPTISKYNNKVTIKEVSKLLANAKIKPIATDFTSLFIIKCTPRLMIKTYDRAFPLLDHSSPMIQIYVQLATTRTYFGISPAKKVRMVCTTNKIPATTII